MTRLTENDIAGLQDELDSLDLDLKKKTGLSLWQIGCSAAGIAEDVFRSASRENQIAVVPITTGLGIIGGFAKSVESIISYLGFKAFVTNATDVSGIAEGINRGGTIIFAADDDQFISLNCLRRRISDNSLATGLGYAAALNAMAGGLEDKEVLVIGAGKVGVGALTFLNSKGALPSVYDLDPNVAKRVCLAGNVRVETDLHQALPLYKYIVDASPAPDILDTTNLHPEVMIAAPGIPLGLTYKALQLYRNRIIHDPLHIGVATMLASSIV